MSGPGDTTPPVLVWDVKGNQWTTVPAADYASAVASGNYAATNQSVVRTKTSSGDTVARAPASGAAAAAAGEHVDTGGAEANAAARDVQREALSTFTQKALTFGEGLTDAITAGFIHDHTQMGEVRREVNPGSSMAGELAGTALGIATGGPDALLARGGEALGASAARSVLGEVGAESGAITRVLSRGITEAGVGAALGGAHAIGSGVADAIVDDKPLSAEAVLHETGLNALLGFGLGAVGAGAGELRGRLAESASRGAVADQGGLLDPRSPESATVADHVQSAISGLDDAVGVHEQRVGVLKSLAEDGHLPEWGADDASLKLREAQQAGEALRAHDVNKALAGDADTYQEFRSRLEDYHESVKSLDETLRPRPELAAPTTVSPVTPAPEPVGPLTQNMRARATPEAGQVAGPDSGVPATPDIRPPVAPAEVGQVFAADQATAKMRALSKAAPAAAEIDGALESSEPGQAPPQQASPAEAPAQPAEPSSGPENDRMKFLDHWSKHFADLGPVSSPGDVAAAKIKTTLDALQAASGGKLDAVASLDAGKTLGIDRARTPLGDALDQVWSIRKVAEAAADEARGVANPMRDTIKDTVKGWVKSAVTHAAGAFLGEEIGGHTGALMGMAMAGRFVGISGRIASATGKLLGGVSAAVDGLLSGRGASVAAHAVAANRAYAYSSEGPVKDPVQRILVLQRAASSADGMHDAIKAQLGDVGRAAPEVAEHVAAAAVNMIKQLAAHAPQITMSRLGEPIAPPAQALRRFQEYENAAHDLDGTLKAIQNGTVTWIMASALRDTRPAIAARIAKAVVADPERLQKLTPQRLCAAEWVSGANLTGKQDGQYLLRQAAAWAPTAGPQQPGPGKTGRGKPQSLKITAPDPTPSQAMARVPKS